MDYQLGEDIKEKLIPRAIDWFTGEALQFEEMDDELGEGDFEDEDDEEDDELSEDRDDEDESDEEVTPTYHNPAHRYADLYLRMTVRNPNKRPLSANKANFAIISFRRQQNGFCLQFTACHG